MKLNRFLRRDRAGSEPTPEDPSLARGRREWADRYAGLSRGKRNWQLAAIGLLAVDGILSVGFMGAAATPTRSALASCRP